MAYDNAADEIEAMLNGTHVNDSSVQNETNTDEFNDEFQDEFQEENYEDNESNQDGLDEDSNTEDTGQENNSGSENNEDTETNNQDDGSDNDTDNSENEDEDKDNDGNTQTEDGNNEGDGSETNEKNDDSNQDTEDKGSKESKVDPEEYAKLKSFYEKVTGEFKANGKTIKGFNDPDKIVQGLQKAIGFEEKNAAINKHKKFLAPLKEKGFLDDPDKFNLAMSIMDGDTEAIKKHLKALEINPVLDLDLEEIKYTPKQHIASEGKVILDEAFDTAESYGIKDKLSEVLGSEFDNDSFKDFIKYPRLREDLITHIQDGTYDLVKSKMDEIRLTDIAGDYKSAKVVDQYRFALEALSKELSNKKQTDAVLNNGSIVSNDTDKAVIKNTADNIMSQAVVLDDKRRAEILSEEEEKFRAEAQKLAADKARKEAASVSKTKITTKTTEKKQEFDPLKLEGDDFRSYFNTLMR